MCMYINVSFAAWLTAGCVQYVGMDLFVRNFFSRLFVINDDMKTVR